MNFGWLFIYVAYTYFMKFLYSLNSSFNITILTILGQMVLIIILVYKEIKEEKNENL